MGPPPLFVAWGSLERFVIFTSYYMAWNIVLMFILVNLLKQLRSLIEKDHVYHLVFYRQSEFSIIPFIIYADDIIIIGIDVIRISSFKSFFSHPISRKRLKNAKISLGS